MLLTPEIYDILAHTKPGAGGEIQLTDAMAEYARTRGGMTAVEFAGKHYDMGNKLGIIYLDHLSAKLFSMSGAVKDIMNY